MFSSIFQLASLHKKGGNLKKLASGDVQCSDCWPGTSGPCKKDADTTCWSKQNGKCPQNTEACGPAPPTPPPPPAPPTPASAATPPAPPTPSPDSSSFVYYDRNPNIKVNMNNGYATTTLYACGITSCGKQFDINNKDTEQQNTAVANWKKLKENGINAIGALPQNMYTIVNGHKYNETGGKYSCKTDGSDLIDNDKKEKVCYRLTDSKTNSLKIMINDTCNGNCVTGFDPKNTCDYNSPSCFDGDNYDDTRQPELRCPPVIYATTNDINMTNKQINGYLKQKYSLNKPIDYNGPINLSPFASVPEKYGHADWCSGTNMHFDIMYSDCVSDKATPEHAFEENIVVKYERVDCGF